MQEITVFYSTTGQFPPQSLSTVRNISRVYRDFDYSSFTHLAIVHTNNVDIGLIGINVTELECTVQIFQAPNVCRMSILSLIDSSIYYLQSLVQPQHNVIFKDVHYAHTFKLKQIVSDISSLDNDLLTNGEKILSVNMSQISLKNIVLEKI